MVCPHRSSTPSGKTFVFQWEEDKGLAQVTITSDIYEKYGQAVFGGSVLVITGVAEKRGAGTFLLAADMREA